MKTARTYSISLALLFAACSVLTAQDMGGRAAFRLNGVSLRSSLDSLMKWFPVFIVYLDRDVEGKSVSASCDGCGAEEALDRILAGTRLFWTRQGNQFMLGAREPPSPRILATLSGTVRDSITGDPVAGATLVLQDSVEAGVLRVRRWCPANSSGFYSLRRVPLGRYMLAVRALGYETAFIPIAVASETPSGRDIVLSRHDITLQEITVEGERSVLTSSAGMARGVYIRSTPSDRNTYMLDGARIYNPSHFGGVLSTFNGETLNDVQVMVGGLPPSYGGDIGGILDLSLREGNYRRLTGSAGTGSLGSSASLEGPLTESTTFAASGRRGYPDPAIPFLSEGGTPGRLGSYEAMGKLTQRFSPASSISLGAYLGGDTYTNNVSSSGLQIGNDFSWGNSMVSLRWLDIAAPSLFLSASADYTRYHFTMGEVLLGQQQLPFGSYRPSRYALEDVCVRLNAEHYYDEEHTLSAGVELTRHGLSGSIDALATQIAPLSLPGSAYWEASIYLQDQWLILPGLMAGFGARATSFSGGGTSFSAIDPRFSLQVSLDERTRCYSSLTVINQFLHPYSSSGVFIYYPALFWYASTDQARPTTSVQATLGLERDLGGEGVVASAEGFYRITHNLHDVVSDTAVLQTQDLMDQVILGEGNVYGLELSLRKRAGNVAGSLTYSLSWANQKFAELNGGQPFVPRFDRRHELQIELSYAPGEQWMVGLLAVLASDLTGSNPEQVTGTRVAVKSNLAMSGTSGLSGIIDVNGNRIPGFQRLELNAAYRVSLWGAPCRLSLRMLNGYGILDPFLWTLRESHDVRSTYDIALRAPDIFPLYPSLGLTVMF